uniref:Phorbol-ester/DAG-type domain-containing protein n=1 Tax=Romanomermis culicivorax TaxID=13658 RepID=A0A915JQJ2_ROMCU
SSSNGSHHWINASFSRGTLCDVCQRKIWLKSALKCEICSMICHKKCVAKSSILRPCGQIFESSAQEDVDGSVNANDEGIEACESMDLLLSDIDVLTNYSDSSQSNQIGYGRRLRQGLSEKIAGLRRRKGKNPNSSEIMVTNPTTINQSLDSLAQKPSGLKGHEVANIFDFSIEENRARFNVKSENIDNTSMLYTKCGTYNEHMIYAAKDLGKDLFSNLMPDERKKKINEESLKWDLPLIH